MTHLHARGIRIPVIGAIGIAGLVGIVKARGGRNRRPTGDQLRKMSDADFASFVQASGLKTVTTADLATHGDDPD